jgi:hypothetical protein
MVIARYNTTDDEDATASCGRIRVRVRCRVYVAPVEQTCPRILDGSIVVYRLCTTPPLRLTPIMEGSLSSQTAIIVGVGDCTFVGTAMKFGSLDDSAHALEIGCSFGEGWWSCFVPTIDRTSCCQHSQYMLVVEGTVYIYIAIPAVLTTFKNTHNPRNKRAVVGINATIMTNQIEIHRYELILCIEFLGGFDGMYSSVWVWVWVCVMRTPLLCKVEIACKRE